MRIFGSSLLVLTASGLLASTALAAIPASSSQANAIQTRSNNEHALLLAHGKYLVTGAAPCADCHTPRDAHGQPMPDHALQGAPIDFTPNHPVPGWEDAAPSIAGLPQGWNLEQTVYFLETGLTPDGGHAGPPMPAFRFNARDAAAIATYLQSLPKPATKTDTHH